MSRMMTTEQAEAVLEAKTILERIEPGAAKRNAHESIERALGVIGGLDDSLGGRAWSELLTAAAVIENRGACIDNEAAIVDLVDALTRLVQVTCPGCGQILPDRGAAIEHIADVLDVEISLAEDMFDGEHERLAFLEAWAGGWHSTVETLGLDGLGPEPRGRVLGQVAKQIDRCMVEARAEIRDAVQDGLGITPELADELIAAAEALGRKPDPELEALRRHADLVEQLANARHGREAPPLLRVDVHGPGDLEGIVWLAHAPRVGDILDLDALGLDGRPACRVTGAVRWLGPARVSVVVTAVEAEDWP